MGNLALVNMNEDLFVFEAVIKNAVLVRLVYNQSTRSAEYGLFPVISLGTKRYLVSKHGVIRRVIDGDLEYVLSQVHKRIQSSTVRPNTAAVGGANWVLSWNGTENAVRFHSSGNTFSASISYAGVNETIFCDQLDKAVPLHKGSTFIEQHSNLAVECDINGIKRRCMLQHR